MENNNYNNQNGDTFSDAERNHNGNREFAEKKLALDQLCDRKFEDVRRETYLDIFYGFKQGTPTAFLGKSFSCCMKKDNGTSNNNKPDEENKPNN